MAEGKMDILFPGVLKGWDSKETALQYLATLGGEAKNETHKVLYHANTSVVSAAGNLMTHRYSAKVDSHKVVDNINEFELTEQENPLKHHLSANYSEWKDKLPAALEALKAVVAPAEEEKKEGEGEEEKKEGEGEGEEKKEGEGE